MAVLVRFNPQTILCIFFTTSKLQLELLVYHEVAMETLARQVLPELLSHICVFAGSKEALLYQQASLKAQERG